jgi:hypothetical protein
MHMTSSWKTLLVWTAAAGLAATAASAQENVSRDADQWAEKMFAETSHDFGSVPAGADVRHKFAVRNIYQETIQITNVTTTCGCTAAQPSQRELKMNETAYIEVVMNTVKFRREKTSNVDVTLTFDGRTYKTVRIPIKAYIRPDVVLEPGRADLGSLEVGAGAEKRIHIAYAGSDDWKINEVKSQNPYITAELTETARGNGRVDYDLLVKLSKDAPLGTVRDQLVLMLNDERSPQVPVAVEGEIVPDIIVTPTTLTLGNLTPGVDKTMTVIVRGHRPFAIEKIECESPLDCFKVRLNKDARNVHVLPITVTPPDKPGEITEKFFLTIAGRDVPVEFTAQGTIAAQETASSQ